VSGLGGLPGIPHTDGRLGISQEGARQNRSGILTAMVAGPARPATSYGYEMLPADECHRRARYALRTNETGDGGLRGHDREHINIKRRICCIALQADVHLRRSAQRSGRKYYESAALTG
jgi:hypothetical protein